MYISCVVDKVDFIRKQNCWTDSMETSNSKPAKRKLRKGRKLVKHSRGKLRSLPKKPPTPPLLEGSSVKSTQQEHKVKFKPVDNLQLTGENSDPADKQSEWTKDTKLSWLYNDEWFAITHCSLKWGFDNLALVDLFALPLVASVLYCISILYVDNCLVFLPRDLFVWPLFFPKSTKSREVQRKYELIAVQGHPWSSTLVSIEGAYATFY